MLFIFNVQIRAQYLALDWVKGQGGTNTERGQFTTIDHAGNVYTLGSFNGTADFDPGPGVFNLTTNALIAGFITKFDASGNFLWAAQLTGDATSGCMVSDIITDPSGNVYVTGGYLKSLDLDPGPGIFTVMSAPSTISGFFVKLDVSGNFLWGKVIGGSGAIKQPKLRLTSSNEMLMVGSFSQTVDFDPGPGVVTSSALIEDIFFLKLSSSGDFLWLKKIEGGGGENIHGFELDPSGNMVMAGWFNTTLDFDPGPGVVAVSPRGVKPGFFLKLNPSGNFVWVKDIYSSGGHIYPSSVAIDGTGSIYIGGDFSGTLDMDPGPGSYPVRATGNRELMLIKLDAAGNFSWGKHVAGFPAILTYSLKSGRSGNVYMTGRFTGTFDFDPGPGIYSLTTFGSYDIFVLALDKQGDFIAVKQMGGTGDDAGNFLSVDDADNVYITGEFQRTAEFNPCLLSSTMTSTGLSDIFTLRLSERTAVVNIVSSAASVCEGNNVTFTASTSNAGLLPSFQWQINGVNSGGNDSVFITSMLSDGDVVSVILTSPCIRFKAVVSNEIAIAVKSRERPSVSITASATDICPGDLVNFTSSTQHGGSAASYQWQVNGINAGTNAPIFRTNSLDAGDTVSVLLTSSEDCVLAGAFVSNKIGITSTIIDPSVSIASSVSPGAICYETTITFTASAVLGGSRPVYHWRVNKIPTGHRSQSFITNSLVDGDEVDCVMISNSPGCPTTPADTSNSIVIKMDPLICPLGFYMPTAFTPNGDGINDFCRPLLLGKVVSYRFALYNRWGQRIFESKDHRQGWDGRVGGIQPETTTFAWICHYQFKDQPPQVQKGTVTLIR